MATSKSKTPGFGVVCPFCTDADAVLSIDLNHPGIVTCAECGEEFTPARAVAKLAEQARRWEAVARWIDLAANAADAIGV